MANSIEIRNVGKRYLQYPSRKARLKEWLFPFLGKRYMEKWVLRDISLDVRQGEAVGIVGMNGAGKSTLLKIITGTTEPTRGTVNINGKTAALLELGLGFHPDFTGRQNVYMSGQLMGYSNEEIDECMQEVEAFTEIGDAIDAPVRTYSSGMQVRLAFSVATMKRPDILIVDEALSVGDAYFQHKSFGRIQSFCNSGTTLLLVSHDATTVQAICNKALLLDKGSIVKIGAPEEIMDYYNAVISGNGGKSIVQEPLPDGRIKTISGNGAVRLTSVNLLNEANEPIEIISVGETVLLKIEAEVIESIPYLNCGFAIKDNLGQTHYGTNSYMNGKKLCELKVGEKILFENRLTINLGEGNYSISVAFVGDGGHIETNYAWVEFAKIFQVINTKNYPFAGCSYLPCELTIDVV